MRKLYAFALLATFVLFISHAAAAQDAPAVPDSLNGWDYSWTFGINGSQAAYSNWSQGGVNTLAAAGNSNFQSLYKKERFSYVFQLETRFGQTRTDGQGVRKTDDRLAISNRFLYDLSEDHEEFKLFANLDFRTQFAKGYDYEAGPNEEDVLISDFMAPGYFVENVGVAYVPTPNFMAEAGFGLVQTIVNDESLSAQYGLPEGDTFRNEAGINLKAAYSMTLADNLSWSSSVETFTNVNKSVSGTDVFFLNKVTGKINSFMNASLRLDLVYDDDFSDEVQVAQVLSLGVSFILI